MKYSRITRHILPEFFFFTFGLRQGQISKSRNSKGKTVKFVVKKFNRGLRYFCYLLFFFQMVIAQEIGKEPDTC